jgi:hypothetical protein
VCAKSSHRIRKFEGLLCGAKDAIIKRCSSRTAAAVAAMRDGTPLLTETRSLSKRVIVKQNSGV